MRKWSIFLCVLVLSCLAGPRHAKAQSPLLKQKFRCPLVRGTVSHLLEDVARRSGIIIEYSSCCISNRALSIGEGEITLGAALQHILAGQRVTVVEENGKLLIVAAPGVLPEDALIGHYALYGYAQDEQRLEPLPFAVIRELPSGPVCQSNVYGYYSLNLPEGKHLLEVSYAGYLSKTMEIVITEPMRMNPGLKPVSLPEFRVEAGNVLRRDGSSMINKDQSAAYNNILGENDPIRSLYLMPGNIESQETTGALLVRGGDPDQSTFLLDGNRVFNPSHLLGEISITNSTSVKSIRQFKGDFPASFGGDGVSSVTEVNTKDGNMDRWSGQANAGFLSGAFTIEGPLQKGRTAMMVSFRHNWTNPVINTLDDNYNIRFYDVHFKMTHLFNPNNKLMASGYLGKDRLDLKESDYQNLQIWGNRLGTINWNHVFGPKAFVNSTFNFSHYRNLAGLKFTLYDDSTGEVTGTRAFNNFASIRQYEFKTQADLIPSPALQFRVGGRFTHTVIHPFNSSISPDLQEEIGYYQPMKPLPFSEAALHGESEIRLTPEWLIRPGIHFSSYWFRNHAYHSFQPRFFTAYRINKNNQLFFSYSRMSQFLHQVSSPFLGINSNFWVPSTGVLRPVESDQFDLGYSIHGKKGLRVSAEGYYRKMYHVTNFTDNGNLFYDEDTWEQDILPGKGWSYGAELLGTKRCRLWHLQLAYTLSWSWRQFADLNNGQKYPYRYDRRHILNANANFHPNSHWDLNVLLHFNTGDCLLVPPGVYALYIAGSGDSSTYRTMRDRSYYRLNFSANFHFNTSRQLHHNISAGLHDVFQSGRQPLPDIWSTGEGLYNVTPPPDYLFKFTWYLSYTLSF
jgi:hypothetical protein